MKPVFVVVSILACACGPGESSSTVPVDAAAGPPTAVSNARPDDTPLPTVLGAMASVPREHWPCAIEQTLRDDGGQLQITLEYGDLQRCLLPAELAASGVVGCPTRMRAFRDPGDDRPYYEIRYTYDAQGRLVSLQDGEAVPDTFTWTGDTLTSEHSAPRTYEATDTGFRIIEGNEPIAEITLEDGRPIAALRRYPGIGQELRQALRWDGARLIEIDGGGDLGRLSYECG